ncbi:MAG: hypothetical protein KDD25_09100, partial [Bdellovibrionales bacterium]|nr:hypothetical protein [Bdellovibrionales bacterium]
MDYGVTNRVGKWNQSDVNQLIRFASNLKIKTYDSAFAYGNAHEVLREAIESSAENVSILTKSGSKNSSELRQDLESAFNLFGDQLYGFSLHSFSQFENEEVRSEWNQIKDQYPSLRMGISVYDDRELVASLESGLFHFVQASGNIFNLNKVRRSLFSKYVSKGFEIHI